MKSLPTIDQINRDNLIEVIRTLDPELYMIKISLEETGLNPLIIPKIIRSIGNLTFGTGYGKVQIFMQAKLITQIKGEENVQVNENAMADEAES